MHKPSLRSQSMGRPSMGNPSMGISSVERPSIGRPSMKRPRMGILSLKIGFGKTKYHIETNPRRPKHWLKRY